MKDRAELWLAIGLALLVALNVAILYTGIVRNLLLTRQTAQAQTELRRVTDRIERALERRR